MDIRYLIIGFLILILGLFTFLFNGYFYLYGIQHLLIIPLFAVFFGIVFIIIGVLDTDKQIEQKKIAKNKNELNKPIEVLKMRYANGEITDKEYQKIKKDLEG